MKKLNDVALKLLAKAAYANAEKEANSACIMNMVIDNFLRFLELM